MPTFPASVDELTPELLTEVLRERQPDVRVATLEVAETARCGDGFASTADRVALDLTYEGDDCGLPRRMLLKTMLATPHAPRAMYANEVRFYSDIRPHITIEAPRSFGCLFEKESAQFGILMEDLRQRDAHFPNATERISVEHVRRLLGNLAVLHATHWQSDRFATDLNWLATPVSGGMFDVFDRIGRELVHDQVDRNPFKAEIIAPLGQTIDQLWDNLWRMQSILAEEPATLLHGDPHCGNTYLLPDGGGGLLDWQLMVRGRWAHDVTYYLITSLDTEDRRQHEAELLRWYLEQLRHHGVEAPTFDDAWQLYRRTVVWGLVIGWLICPTENYGEEITAANIRRIVAAAQDLETFSR